MNTTPTIPAYAGQAVHFVGRTFYAFDRLDAVPVTLFDGANTTYGAASVAFNVVNGVREVRGSVQVPGTAAVGDCLTIRISGTVNGTPRQQLLGVIGVVARPVNPLIAGARLVRVTLRTPGGDPIAGAKVRLSGPTPNLAETDAQGVAAMGVDDGTYTVSAWKPGYEAFAPVALAVAGNVDVAYALTPSPPPLPPVDASLSLVTVTVVRVDNTPVVGGVVSYLIVDPPDGDPRTFDAHTMKSPPTDENGQTQFEVLLGSRVRFDYAGGYAIQLVSTSLHNLTIKGRAVI